ncbi:MAG TPA: hypothetical protein VFQ13_14565, partial [Anaerolineales bacterium]|nr:hypothetical protein [Anaerolineales bacterium]
MDNQKKLTKWIARVAILMLTLELFVVSPVKANQGSYRRSGNNSYDEMDAYIEEQLRALNLPGASLAIVEGDQVVHTKGFGVSGPARETPTP